MNKLFFLLSILFILTSACKKIERINPKDGIAGVTTSEAKQIDLSTLQITSSLTKIEGVSDITQRGVCWSTNPNPTTANYFTNDGSGFGTFETKIGGLSVNQTYYFRAFASNQTTTVYGNEVSFKFNIGPTIVTKQASSISYNSANIGCNLLSIGGYAIKEQGVFWGMYPGITENNQKIIADKANFDFTLSGLDVGKTYYYRSFVLTDFGYVFGQELSFITLGGNTPSISTKSMINIGENSAISGGKISSNGGLQISEKGVCWSVSGSPTINDNKTLNSNDSIDFNCTLTGLASGTKYYVRAYATNSKGTSYGNEISFTTYAYNKPTITTSLVSNITKNSALGGGEIVSDGGLPILNKGICWSTKSNPTISDSKTSDGTGISKFTSQLTGLSPGVKYYVRSYASNSKGTSYGNEISFITLDNTLPVLSTTPVNSINFTSAATGGNISSDGGLSIIEKGVCWSTNANPTISDNKTLNGSGLSNFTSQIKDLQDGTKYYVRAYATNAKGTSYGNEISFTTIAYSVPVLSTTAVNSINFTSAATGGNISSDGGLSIIEKGVCWSTSANPTISDNKTLNVSLLSNFTIQIKDLQDGTKYYVRAYATNAKGTSYGDEISFTTIAYSVPALSTTPVNSINFTSAATGGNISSDGGLSIIEKGVCWSTNANPTISDNKTSNITGLSNFTSQIKDLQDGTKYYVRAYATNAKGTSYGNEINFTTIAYSVPVLTTNPLTSINRTSAALGGTINYDGGLPITAKGICWSINSNPTLSDNNTLDGTGTADFISFLNNLSVGTTYYVRAFATNEKGTNYGNELSFTTNFDIPVVLTQKISNISNSSATCGGIVKFEGDFPIIAKGVCWSLSQNPTINDNKTNDGSGNSEFSSNINGLLAGSMYFIRSYVTTIKGTYYGDEASCTILIGTIAPNITDIQGNLYKTVYIGNQQWMAENLKVTAYNDGTSIPNIADNTQWANYNSAAWTYLENNILNNTDYGKLYNWYAISSSENNNRNVCPTGWHVPSNSDWSILIDYLGEGAGGKMKQTGIENWNTPNLGASNSSLFNALPGGRRSDDGSDCCKGTYGTWWSSTANSMVSIWYNSATINSPNGGLYSLNKKLAYSVRCVKD